MDPHGHSQTPGTSPLLSWKACGDTPFGSLLLHSFVESWRASIRLAGAPAMVAGLTECDLVRAPSGQGTDGSGLGPFGCPEPLVSY